METNAVDSVDERVVAAVAHCQPVEYEEQDVDELPPIIVDKIVEKTEQRRINDTNTWLQIRRRKFFGMFPLKIKSSCG